MHRRYPFMLSSMALLSLLSTFAEPLSSFAGARDAKTPPGLKSDTPKLDTPFMLKGGVHHTHRPEAKHVLSTGTKKTAETGKISSIAPKLDKSKPLKAGGNQTNLNAGATATLNDPVVPNGIGIIGVKFALGIGSTPIINRVFPGTPAYSNGLRPMDAIVAVDGVPTMGLTKEEVYNMIIGSPGTPVTLSVRRRGDFSAKKLVRMDFNDIKDPIVRHDYLVAM